MPKTLQQNSVAKNLFVVESPFQLLSAMEARNYFSNEHSTLIIKYSGFAHRNNDAQIRMVSGLDTFDEVIEIRPFSGVLEANLRLMMLLRKLIKQDQKFTKIFLGEYRSWYQRKFLKLPGFPEGYILDDGSSTIVLQRDHLSKGTPYFLSTGLRRKIQSLYYGLISILLKDSAEDFAGVVHLFTCFDLQPVNERQKVIRHTFPFIKAHSRAKKVAASSIYFFGSPLSERRIISREQELALLGKIAAYYTHAGRELIYVTHRGESHEKLQQIRMQCGMEITTFGKPAEIQFLLMDVLPAGIASFVSTALFTVSSMFSFESVEVFHLPLQDLPEVNRKAYISIYAEYRKTMRVVDLNDLQKTML